MSFYNAALISGLEEEVTGSDKTFKYTIKVLGAMAPQITTMIPADTITMLGKAYAISNAILRPEVALAVGFLSVASLAY